MGKLAVRFVSHWLLAVCRRIVCIWRGRCGSVYVVCPLVYFCVLVLQSGPHCGGRCHGRAALPFSQKTRAHFFFFSAQRKKWDTNINPKTGKMVDRIIKQLSPSLLHNSLNFSHLFLFSLHLFFCIL